VAPAIDEQFTYDQRTQEATTEVALVSEHCLALELETSAEMRTELEQYRYVTTKPFGKSVIFKIRDDEN
jgi:hypothetical protein